MNGIHDMGGMQDMGPVRHEDQEPPFHEAWEGRIFAISRALRTSGLNVDASRHAIEQIPPAEYLRMSYYERWITRNIELLVQRGIVTREELETGKPAPGSKKATPSLNATSAAQMALIRGNFLRPQAQAIARFKVGQHVRARNLNPPGHTRLPRYAKGKSGTVARHRGIFVFPDTNAHFLGEEPQHLYSVRFTARELWGESASARDSVYLDMWDTYLEHA
jgi:nitrile hydratase subunit beta